MGRSSHRRIARLAGTVLAILLSWQTAGGALAAAWEMEAAHCCCHHGEHCKCPICTHARGNEANERQMRTCGGGATQLVLAEALVYLPPVSIEEEPLPLVGLPESVPPEPGVPPSRDVPTPPPLA